MSDAILTSWQPFDKGGNMNSVSLKAMNTEKSYIQIAFCIWKLHDWSAHSGHQNLICMIQGLEHYHGCKKSRINKPNLWNKLYTNYYANYLSISVHKINYNHHHGMWMSLQESWSLLMLSQVCLKNISALFLSRRSSFVILICIIILFWAHRAHVPHIHLCNGHLLVLRFGEFSVSLFFWDVKLFFFFCILIF